MKESVIKFAADELARETDPERKKQLRAIHGYLIAARDWRSRCTVKRGGEYVESLDYAYQFDTDCARVDP